MCQGAGVHVDLNFKLEIDFETFSIDNTSHGMCRVQIWGFFGFVCYLLIFFALNAI